MTTMLQTLQDAYELGPGFVVRRALAGSRAQIRIPVRGIGPFVVRPGTRDVDAVRAVFRDHRYRLPNEVDARVQETYEWLLRGGRTPLVLDTAAGIGTAARWFRARYPDAAVVAVEPDPDAARLCRVNTARADVEVRRARIGPDAGPGTAPVVTVGRMLDARAADQVPFLVALPGGLPAAGGVEWLSSVTVVHLGRVTVPAHELLTRRGFDLHVLPHGQVYVRR